MKIYNPFSNESYDSSFSPLKLVKKCSKSTYESENEDVFFELRKLVIIVKNQEIRKKVSINY